MENIQIGTRQSDLAMTQTQMVSEELSKFGFESQIKKILTIGDQDYREFKNIPGDGFFTKELEKHLLKDSIDLAVHSCKDLPSMTHIDLPWFAFSQREDTSDILITSQKNLSSNKIQNPGFRIGTSSPRRTSQLKKLYPDSQILNLRGNVPSRIQKALSSDYDGVVLAKAGVSRLGLDKTLQSQGLAAVELPLVTAPCQGVLAVQTRAKNKEKFSILENSDLQEVALLEKSILSLFGGGCHLALGAQIQKHSNQYHLKFFIDDNSIQADFEDVFSSPTELLRSTLIQSLGLKNQERKVWLTQPLQHQVQVAQRFHGTSLTPVPIPQLRIRPSWSYSDFLNRAENFKDYSSLVFTSRFGVRLFFLEFLSLFPDIYKQIDSKKIFCVGKGTQAELNHYYKAPSSLPKEQTGEALFDLIPDSEYPLLMGTQDSEFLEKYRQSGRKHAFLNLYRGFPDDSPLNNFDGASPQDSLVFTSPLAAEYFFKKYPNKQLAPKVFAFGPVTSKKLLSLGVEHFTNPESGSWDSMMDLVFKS